MIVSLGSEDDDPLNPAVYQYLDHSEIVEVLELFYIVEKNQNGEIKRLY